MPETYSQVYGSGNQPAIRAYAQLSLAPLGLKVSGKRRAYSLAAFRLHLTRCRMLLQIFFYLSTSTLIWTISLVDTASGRTQSLSCSTYLPVQTYPHIYTHIDLSSHTYFYSLTRTACFTHVYTLAHTGVNIRTHLRVAVHTHTHLHVGTTLILYNNPIVKLLHN